MLDTNIFLDASDLTASSHTLAIEAIARLLEQGKECVITAQVLIEFWVVATCPVAVNNLGWSVEYTSAEIKEILNQFSYLKRLRRYLPIG